MPAANHNTPAPDALRAIRDYLDAVATQLAPLPPLEREEILRELEAHIHDALQDRLPDSPPGLLDVQAVLADMDPPESYRRAAGPARPPGRRRGLALAAAGAALLVGLLVLAGPSLRAWLWPARPEGDSDNLIAQPASKLTLENAHMESDGAVAGGVVGTVWAREPVAVPFRAHFVARTDSINLRLYYARGSVIFNWEGNPRLLWFQDPAGNPSVSFLDKGQIPVNQWVDIELLVTESAAEVFIDGVSRARLTGSFAGLAGKLGIGSRWGSVVTVKTFRVTPLPGAQSRPH